MATVIMYNLGVYTIATQALDWTSATIKARPVLTADTPDIDATSMTGEGETGYDVTLTNCTITNDTTNDRCVFDSDNFTWSAVAAIGEINRYVLFKFITNDAASIPIATVELSTPITPGGFDIAVTVASTGHFYTDNTPA